MSESPSLPNTSKQEKDPTGIAKKVLALVAGFINGFFNGNWFNSQNSTQGNSVTGKAKTETPDPGTSLPGTESETPNFPES